MLYSSFLGSRHRVEDIWRRFVADGAPLEQHCVGSSHFLINQRPTECLQLYDAWLRQIDG